MRVFAAAGLAAVVLTAAATTAGAAQAAGPSVDIRNAVARVTVVPSDRADVEVVIRTPNAKLPLRIDRRGDRVIVNGDLKWNKIRSCRGSGNEASVEVRGVGKVGWDEMPQITIYTPRDVDIEAGGAVFGMIGRAESVDLDNSGCGDWQVGNVTGKLEVSQAGSGDVFAGTAGTLAVSVAGSGDTRVKEVAGGADVSIAGSGDVVMASIAGNLEVSIAGSGDVKVLRGHAGKVEVNVAGSGDVRFNGEADSVDISVMGSGDVWVTKVNGNVQKSVMGSGGVHIGAFEMPRT
ncbi:MAG: DUF2807 domain-containing protein [Caulobacter sp.]|nr:DUF2807 domain-containing protein [Caulobacter sp.]